MRIRANVCVVMSVVPDTEWALSPGPGRQPAREGAAIQPHPHPATVSSPWLCLCFCRKRFHDDCYAICILYCDYYVNIRICNNDYYVICVMHCNYCVNENEQLTLTYVSWTNNTPGVLT